MAFTATATSSRARIKWIAETNVGETPSTPVMQQGRITSETLTKEKGTTTSQELVDHRNVPSSITTAFNYSGDVGVEWSYASHDELLESTLQGTWSGSVDISATDIEADAATNSFESTTTDFSAEDLSVGQYVYVQGFSDSANNGYFRIASVSTNTLEVNNKLGSTLGLVDEGAGSNITMKTGGRIRNGVTRKSFTVEVENPDVQKFKVFRGVEVDTLEFTASTGSILTASFGMVARSSERPNSTVANSVTQANTNRPFNAVQDWGYVEFDDTMLAQGLGEFTFSLENGLRRQGQMGTADVVGYGNSRNNITATLQSWFDDQASQVIDKFESDDFVAPLTFNINDKQGNVYIFSLAQLHVTTANTNNDGLDNDVVVEAEGQGVMSDDGEQWTIQIDRIPA